MACTAITAEMDLHDLTGASGGVLCSTSAAEDGVSVCSMDMSTTDSCSELGSDVESSFDSDYDSSDGEDGSQIVSPFTSDQTLLIFDWDDTILPSTWIQQQGLRLDDASVVSQEQQKQLAGLAQCAIRTLKAAKRYGTVILVTNAERGWIELSSRKFLPSLCPLLESVKILSARAAHEKPGVSQPSLWKSLAFRKEINSFYKPFGPDGSKNIVSFGDAMYERQAVFQVTSGMTNCCTKSFKFMEKPSIEQLQKEHELIYWCLRHIASHSGALDLQVQIA